MSIKPAKSYKSKKILIIHRGYTHTCTALEKNFPIYLSLDKHYNYQIWLSEIQEFLSKTFSSKLKNNQAFHVFNHIIVFDLNLKWNS